MPEFPFEWDPAKARSNLAKHRVSFQEAQTVFVDPGSLTVYDERHAEHEDRYFILGLSATGRLLAVAFAERGKGLRIISARVATRQERSQYARANPSQG
jgi:uncharacterized DUF497 family protein